MHPILFKIWPITVYSYGFALAGAFIIGFFLLTAELERKKIETGFAYDLVLAAIIGGVIGARFFYVLAHLDYFSKYPLQIFFIQEGLVFYGGLAGGTLAVLSVVYRKKLPVSKIADAVAPCLAIGTAIGRIGCFLNGCCYGKPTNIFWAVKFPGVPLTRHPTQIYDLIYNLIIFCIIWSLRKKINKDGMIFWFYLFFYSIGRFSVEFFRVSALVLWGLTMAQIISIGLFLVSLMILLKKYSLLNFY
ncbi:prolipoprotein diacylglyceryl transferase [Candidatus Oleimmundimicrobium sp.]|uniref:prolipoprotein diacylglyceryl transferase n=1 Tax=Candidatus Oleimmundimicrobium sp. TaxID=3060597 RepID=UPI002725E6BD|nr:prolipoprotein diacylglyceryl transferase [Candidatus Oleimmundimicrobium sp.]MDO8886478.1 prolipoprotein diacylglyceryl transferase [Candidatus Oleimmundimicrobium sp.]